MKFQQIPFPIDFSVSYLEADFFCNSSNENALEMLGSHKFLLLTGEESSGKTHLSHIFCERFGGTLLDEEALEKSFATIDLGNSRFVIDDVDKLSTETHESLFHLYNHINITAGGLLLLTSTQATQAIINAGGLGDWHSRLLSFQQGDIMTTAADDELLLAYLRKNFQDRQIYPKSNELEYILKKCRRDFASLLELVKVIHKRMLEKQAKLSKSLIAELLQTL